MAITVEDVKNLRERFGLSMMDAKKFLTLREEQAILDVLQENGTLEDKVNFLLNRMKADVDYELIRRFQYILNNLGE